MSVRRVIFGLAASAAVLACAGAPRIAEDSPRWRCAIDGNGVCGPGCYVEPSNTPEGFEVIAYTTPNTSPGFAVPCPGGSS